MNNELIEQTKKAMGYKEGEVSCQNCKHSKEEEDKHVDRSWYRVCYFSNLCPFTVKDKARCNHFKAQ